MNDTELAEQCMCNVGIVSGKLQVDNLKKCFIAKEDSDEEEATDLSKAFNGDQRKALTNA